MRKYNGVFIYQAGDEKLAAGKEIVNAEFKNSGINIIKEDDRGTKDLAYEVKKQTKGYYVSYDLEADPAVLKQFEKTIKLKSEILKFVFFKKGE